MSARFVMDSPCAWLHVWSGSAKVLDCRASQDKQGFLRFMRLKQPARISVVVPVLNGARVLGGALRSLTSQAGVDLQIILMDGGSSDGTQEVVREFAHAIDTIVSEPDAGQAAALNKGFARADGEYFAWLCADDRLRPGALEALAGTLASHPDAVLATGNCLRQYTWGEQITAPPADFHTRLQWMNTIDQPASLWRSDAHRRAGDLDTGLKYAFDWEFWLRLRRLGDFVAIDRLVADYVFSGENLTATGGDQLAEEMYRVMKRHGPQRGALADAYRFLYHVFDKRGFYDAEPDRRPPTWARAAHHLVLAAMHRIYGREQIDSYNWNFASRQARGLDVF
ncbi:MULTISPECIES: glycosyltransferase family 2 protein [Hyphobacterium]|uniref:Glycosyltransferase family 2 protein n=1 Tax=Hyphobacterium vulgare TaxID=1736751 RepID=A0ABV6ZVG2_9PROT